MDAGNARNCRLSTHCAGMAEVAGQGGDSCARLREAVSEIQPVKVRHVESQDRGAWERFVETHPSTTAYHQLGWKRVVEEAFGHPTHYLLSEDEQRGIT